MTTRIPADSDTEAFTGGRPGHPTPVPAESIDKARPVRRQPGRRLSPVATNTGNTEDAGTSADREGAHAGQAVMTPNASPWQRSHSVWHRAGVGWMQAADAPETRDTQEQRTAASQPASARPPVPRRSGRVGRVGRRVGRAGLLAVVGALVAGVAVYALRSGDEKETPAQPVAADASEIFTPDPLARTDGRSQALTAVAAAGNTIVALGSDQVRGQFLTSADGGRSWRLARVRAADGGEPPPAEFPRQVAGAEGAWLALGGPAGSPATGGTVVWTSGDGHTWTRQADTSAFMAGDRVSAVVRTDSGFVAVGAAPDGALVWISPDGRTWQRAAAGQAGLAGLTGVVRFDGLAAVGDTLVAQGTYKKTVTRTVTKEKKQQQVRTVVEEGGHWRSTDGGRRWTGVDIPQGQGSYGTGKGLTSGSGRFFLIREARGDEGDGKKKKTIAYAVVFGSVDGATWTPAGRLTDGGYLGVDRLSGGAAGLAAFVRVGGDKTAVMRSADGRTWQRAGDIADRVLTDLAVLPSATVVTGRRGDDAYLSVTGAGDVDLTRIAGVVQPERTITGLAPYGARIVAVGSTNGDAAAWITEDGRSWRRGQGAEFGGDGAQWLTDAVHGDRGWVAVGQSAREPLVVTSADGTTWRRSSGFSRDFRPTGVTYGPAGYVVVGEVGRQEAAAWHSADLKTWARGIGDLKGMTRMSDVAPVSGGYVAVGDDLTRGQTRQPTVRISADGEKWTPGGAVPLPTGTTSGALTRVVARGDTLVALGTGFVAVSADGGRTWWSQPVPGPLPGPTTVTVTPEGFVAAGTVGAAGRTDVTLWSSADGRIWRQIRPHGTGLDGPGAQRLTALATLGDDLLAVGVSGDHRGETPTLWRTPHPRPS